MRPRPGLRPALLALAATALAAAPIALPPAASAAATAPPAKRCEDLRGRDLAPGDPRLKLVRLRLVERGGRATSALRGHALYGCTGRLGRVRRLGFTGTESFDGTSVASSRFSVVATAGTWIVGRSRYGTLEGEDGETWAAHDVVTDRSYPLFDRRSGLDVPALLPVPTAAVIDAAGRSAAIYAGSAEAGAADLPAGATAAVATFDVGGLRTLVDTGGPEIGPRSLHLAGSAVTWSHGPETRTADLAALRGLAPAGGHPVDCGVSPSGTYRLQAARTTPCAFAVRTYAAFAAELQGDAPGLVPGTASTFRLTVQSPASGRTVVVRGRVIPRAHGEFDFTFVSSPPGLAVRFNNLTLP